jgi:branched-chain amino acid transport system substrate-binding protein
VNITLGLSLSLSGKFAPLGRQIEDALHLFVSDINAAGGLTIGAERGYFALRCHDDRSEQTRCAAIYRELCAGTGSDIVLGPYSSELTAVAAPIAEERGRLFINHAAAADDLYRRGYKMIVGLPTPASQYLDEFIHLLASLKFWRKRLALITEPTDFTRSLSIGALACMREPPVRRKGVRLRVKWEERLDSGQARELLVSTLRRDRINSLVSAGSYDHDLAVMRAVLDSELNIPVLACVAAGRSRFGPDLGERAEGIVGTSQWEPGSQVIPELGPGSREFAHRMRTQTRTAACDHVAAQAYAAGVLAAAVIGKLGACDQVRMREQFSTLRTGTLFGAFEIDPESGCQVAHHMLTVQWHKGSKVPIEPHPPLSDRGSSEYSAGWRLLEAGAQILGLGDRGKRNRGDGYELDRN